MTLGRNGQLLSGIQHVFVVQTKVLGQLIDSDFAAAGHSGLRSVRARCASGHHSRWGQCSSCLSDCLLIRNQSLLQSRHHGVRHLASQGFLQSFPTLCFFETALLRTEIGRTAHSVVKENPIPMVTHNPPEKAAVQQQTAGDTTSQDRALWFHRAPSSEDSLDSGVASLVSAASPSDITTSSTASSPYSSFSSSSSSGRG